MTNTLKVGKYRTSIRTDDDGVTAVRYHNTDVVRFDQNSVVLDSGGWRTYTTKTRMNQASNQFGLGFHVYQENFDWFVVLDWYGLDPIPFVDGMKIARLTFART